MAETAHQYASLEVLVRLGEPEQSLPKMSRIVLLGQEHSLSSSLNLPLESYSGQWKRNAPDQYTTRFDGLAPGTYTAVLLPHGVQAEFVLERGKARSIEMTVPVLQRVELTVVSTETGKPVPDGTVVFRPAGLSSPAAWEEGTYRQGGYYFSCAPGLVEVVFSAPAKKTAVQEFYIEAGPENTALAMSIDSFKSNVLRLRAIQGAAAVPLPLYFWQNVRVESADGRPGRVMGIQFDSKQVAGLQALDAAGAEYFLSESGTYDITMPETIGVRVVELSSRANVPEDGFVEVIFSVDLR